MLLQQLGHDIVFLLQFGFEMLDFLILGVFLSFDVMAVWLAFKDNGSFFEEQLLPLVELDGMDFVLVHQCGHRDAIDKIRANASKF